MCSRFSAGKSPSASRRTPPPANWSVDPGNARSGLEMTCLLVIPNLFPGGCPFFFYLETLGLEIGEIDINFCIQVD